MLSIIRKSHKSYETIELTKRKGFTLVELIIVLAVMAIIAAVAIPNFTDIQNNAKSKADVQTCETIKRTVMMLLADDSINGFNGEKTITYNAKSQDIVGLEGESANNLKTALREVKPPATNKEAPYIITISADNIITVDIKTKA